MMLYLSSSTVRESIRGTAAVPILGVGRAGGGARSGGIDPPRGARAVIAIVRERRADGPECGWVRLNRRRCGWLWAGGGAEGRPAGGARRPAGEDGPAGRRHRPLVEGHSGRRHRLPAEAGGPG